LSQNILTSLLSYTGYTELIEKEFSELTPPRMYKATRRSEILPESPEVRDMGNFPRPGGIALWERAGDLPERRIRGIDMVGLMLPVDFTGLI
jgi:hypothetical protein